MSVEKNLLILFSVYLLAMGIIALDAGMISIPRSFEEIRIKPVVPVSVEALAERPDNYMNREISASGTLQVREEIRAGSNVVYLVDDKGNSIDVILSGTLKGDKLQIGKGGLTPGQFVSITGVFVAHELCSCQVRLEGWDWTESFTRTGKVDECLSGALMPYGENIEFRCAPGTTKETLGLEQVER